MSTPIEKRAEQLEQIKRDRIFTPAFVKFAKAKNLQVNTQEELDQLLKIARDIATYEEAQAQPAVSIYKQASAALEQMVSGKKPSTPSVSDVVRELSVR